MHDRISEHHSSYNKLLRRLKNEHIATARTTFNIDIDDEQILGAHQFLEHDKTEIRNFNDCYVIDILAHCNSSNIRETEQYCINKSKTLTTYGLNQYNSIGDYCIVFVIFASHRLKL